MCMSFMWLFLALALLGGVILFLRTTINRPEGERTEHPDDTPRGS